MRIPESLSSLVDTGIIEAVVRPLMSGKEAQIYLLRSGGELRVAKVYKAAQDRSFRQRAEYTEGRTVRNTRDQRAMSKRTRHGREQDEIAWRATEVDMIYRLHAAGVRVPKPYHFIDGVLIMELIVDSDGDPASRLGDIELDRESALVIYDQLLRYVVKMLCADVVHGDLSDFNVLLAPEGPVIIDFPQAVNAAGNQNARKLLLRDVDNLHRFLARYAPEHKALPYAEEMWQLYQRGELTPDVQLSGRYRAAANKVDTALVLDLIADAEKDERRRRTSLGLSMRGAGDASAAPARERQPDTRQPQPQRGQSPADPRRQRPDPRQAQPPRAVAPARPPHPGGDRRPKHGAPHVEQRQPARGQGTSEHRPPQRDARAPQVEQRQPARAQGYNEPGRPQRDSRAPQLEQRQPAPVQGHDERRRPHVEQRQPARGQGTSEHRPLPRDSRAPQVEQRQPARAQGHNEPRPPQRDARAPRVEERQPARAQGNAEPRQLQRDSRQPARAELTVEQRQPQRDSRHVRAEAIVEHRQPQRDARAPNVVERQRQPQRDSHQPARGPNLAEPQRPLPRAQSPNNQRQPQRDSHQPVRAANAAEQRQHQPAHGHNGSPARGQPQPIEPKRATATSPLPAARPRRPQPHRD